MYDLHELIERARAHLAGLGYSELSIREHEYSWRRLLEWCDREGVSDYDHDAEGRYLDWSGLSDDGITQRRRAERAHVVRLLAIAETGDLPRFLPKRRFEVPEGFGGAYEAYSSELERRGLADSTRAGYLCTVRRFCANCGADSPEALGPTSLGTFAGTLAGMAAQTRSACLYVARDFTRHLASAGLCPASVASAAPVIPGHKHSAVPSAYTADEVSATLAGPPPERSPRRGRAIMLLAAVLGMRVGDIKALRMSDVDWRAKTVSFVQGKTKVPNVLPMPEEVWLALADYVKNERPESDSDVVFLTARAPYRPISRAHTLHHMVSKAYDGAGVDVGGKHHGMHSLRHSAATNMLSGGTGYPVISAVLGHSSANVTRRYLSIDVESLRQIALEVPECDG